MKSNKISQAGNPVSAQARGQTNLPLRILVVDDDIGMRQLSAEVLIRSGYHVNAAEDVAAGWESIHASRYDLLIIDNNMPKGSGVELVKKLRSARMALPAIPASGAMPAEDLDGHP